MSFFLVFLSNRIVTPGAWARAAARHRTEVETLGIHSASSLTSVDRVVRRIRGCHALHLREPAGVSCLSDAGVLR